MAIEPGSVEGGTKADSVTRLAGVEITVRDPPASAAVLEHDLRMTRAGSERGVTRFTTGATYLDVVGDAEGARGLQSTGTIHHVAFRAADDAEQLAWRERLLAAGHNVTPVRDRNYFRSIYFHEPGGVLFEIATDPPGFTVDEPADRLGTGFKLPAGYEHRRAEIEAAVPRLRLPGGGGLP